jgi:hypothetical protein
MESDKDITADSQVHASSSGGAVQRYPSDRRRIRVGLFKALAEAPGPSGAELAQRLGLHAPFVETWCKTAYGMQLLDADPALRYRLAPYFDSILANPTHPRLGGYVRLGTEVAAEDFQRCVQALRTGEVKPFQAVATTSPSHRRVYLGSAVTAKKILPALAGSPSGWRLVALFWKLVVAPASCWCSWRRLSRRRAASGSSTR